MAGDIYRYLTKKSADQFFTEASNPLLDPLILSLTAPDSPLLEAYRRLYRKIYYLHKEDNVKSIAITSAQALEGKTLTAINLALACAEDTSKKIALMDCDFRRSQVSKYLGGQKGKALGLIDVVKEEASFEEIATPINKQWPNLDVFPAGHLKGDPYSLLYGNQLNRIMTEAKNAYDLIIIDCPPVMPILDQDFLAEIVDGIIMVIRAGRSNKKRVKEAMEQMEGKNLIGILFNDVQKPIIGAAYYYYDANYGYYENQKQKNDG